MVLGAAACASQPKPVPAKNDGSSNKPPRPHTLPAQQVSANSKPLLDRAKKLAEEILIVDTHVDLPYRLYDPENPKAAPKEDVAHRTDAGDFDLIRARLGGLDAPFMSIYVPASTETFALGKESTFDGAKKTADALIDLVEGLAQKSPELFVVAHSVEDVRKAKAAGKIAFPLGMENGSPLENDLANLTHFHGRGIRYITLAHSKDNHISDSSYDEAHSHKGLSEFGKKVVKEMNRLGVMVDISHLSDDAARAVLETTTTPVIASHSSCRHFTPGFERNMDDDLIKALAKNGGVVQINFGSTFIDGELQRAAEARYEAWQEREKSLGKLSDEGKKKAKTAYYEVHGIGYAGVEQVADHIEHVIKLVGVDHVGFGSDFDGVGDSLPYGLKDVSAYPNLIRVLLERGHSEDEIRKIAGENLLRVWSAVEAAAENSSSEPPK